MKPVRQARAEEEESKRRLEVCRMPFQKGPKMLSPKRRRGDEEFSMRSINPSQTFMTSSSRENIDALIKTSKKRTDRNCNGIET